MRSLFVAYFAAAIGLTAAQFDVGLSPSAKTAAKSLFEMFIVSVSSQSYNGFSVGGPIVGPEGLFRTRKPMPCGLGLSASSSQGHVREQSRPLWNQLLALAVSMQAQFVRQVPSV
jgi:hypothetical protein